MGATTFLTLEREVYEQCQIIHSLLALGQFGKHQKPPPTPASSWTHALQHNSERVQVALCDAASANHPDRANIFKAQKYPREDNADGEDPLRNGKGNRRLDLTGPAVEGK